MPRTTGRNTERGLGREVVRNGVRGHMINVAPKKGYIRFVRSRYHKDTR